jgi:hypothetical protein
MAILEAIYDPAAYFGCERRVGRILKRSRSHRMVSGALRSFVRLLWRIPNAGPEPAGNCGKRYSTASSTTPGPCRVFKRLPEEHPAICWEFSRITSV